MTRSLKDGKWSACEPRHPRGRERDFLDALAYYAAISPELGVQFYREIEQLIADVCDRPQLYRQFDPPARRHFTGRFPYGIVYLLEPDRIWIVAVMHLHKEPGYWRDRVT
jgi:plasmid stabilization system protein ParE